MGKVRSYHVLVISIGIAQIPNSTDVSKNFDSIKSLLDLFASTQVDLIVFPECGLSGFSAKMRECTTELLQPYLDKIAKWVDDTGIEVVLPTAFVEDGKIYNSGFWFKKKSYQRFYKLGLTESEKKFFSVPEKSSAKVFKIKDYNLGLLVCFEVEQQPWAHFQAGDVDAILWPGYWGWTTESVWEEKRDENRKNPIFANMHEWQVPLLQANFAYNDLEGHVGSGPEGLSYIVGHDNRLLHKGPHAKSEGFIVRLNKVHGQTVVESISGL